MHSLRHRARSPSRRTVLQTGVAGVFVLGFYLPARAVNEPEQPPDNTQGKFAPNAFIRIDRSGQTTLVMPQVEMGQGVYTAIPMILAEELDADFGKVVWSMRRLTTSSTVIRPLGFKSPAIPIPSAPSGSRCARREPRRG